MRYRNKNPPILALLLQVTVILIMATKRTRPCPDPEYDEDTPNLVDLWKQVLYFGSEWDQMDLVKKYNWNFANLVNAFEEGGVLHGKKVYLFGCSEPQLLPFKGEMKLTLVPAVIAVIAPFPPSDKIGIISVQTKPGEIVHMNSMKMDWIPYFSFENRDRMVEGLKSEIFILGCNQRRSAPQHSKEDRVVKFEHCLPYFCNLFEKKDLENTVVTTVYDMDNKQVLCEFDWMVDELEKFTEKLISEYELPSDQKENLKNHIKEKVQDARQANWEAREAQKRALDEMSEETIAALTNLKFYKFYPLATPDTPDVSEVKSPFINRYYGTAQVVL